MLREIILAVVAAVVAYLICVIVGGILASLGVAIAVTIGNDLIKYAGVISVLAFLYYAFIGELPRV